MSGGAFNYAQFHLIQLADDIEQYLSQATAERLSGAD